MGSRASSTSASWAISVSPTPAPPPAPGAERRPRPDRERERGYSASDAVQEPEGGIDTTLAAAFAGVREQLVAAEAVADEPGAAEGAPGAGAPGGGGGAGRCQVHEEGGQVRLITRRHHNHTTRRSPRAGR